MFAMNAINDLIYMAILGSFLLLPWVLVGLDIFYAVKKKKKPIFEIIAFGCGFIYMVLCWILWSPLPYDVPINLYGMESAHTPIHMEHMPTLVTFVGIGFLSYFILKFCRKHMAPLAKVIWIAGIYGGVITCVVFVFQLLCGANPEGIGWWAFWGENVIFVFCECVVPVLFFIHVADLFRELVREQAQIQEEVIYENLFLQRCNEFLNKGANLYWVALIVMLPLYGIVICILCLFGQKPDSVIQAFTKTSDWVLSTEIAPPPVEQDVHYLCTVSLQGHRKLVKPIRYGIRRGNRIVVNRQLCVANAFEQLLEERTPRFHRAVRDFYDKYGYPISKWITNPWSADVVYLLMKPLEWIFVAVLYLFDEKPESRIASQYLPKGWKKEEKGNV